MKKLIGILIFIILSCKSNQNSSLTNNEIVSQSSAISDRVYLNVSLVDAPRDDIQNVFVNIDYIELKVKKGNRERDLKAGVGAGITDLLTLQNGMSLDLGDLVLPANSELTQVRLVLNDDGNEIFFKDSSSCNLQTPSQQESGLKILMKNAVVESGFDYSLVIDFDALKSVLFTGQGDCILKPVLKVKSLNKEVSTGTSPSDDTSDEKEDVIENFDDDFFDPIVP